MDNRSYEIKYRFQGPDGTYIQQIKYLDVHIDSLESERYQWFMIKKPFSPHPMRYFKQVCNTSYFNEGTLVIHPDYAIFNGDLWDLKMPRFPIVMTQHLYFHGNV